MDHALQLRPYGVAAAIGLLAAYAIVIGASPKAEQRPRLKRMIVAVLGGFGVACASGRMFLPQDEGPWLLGWAGVAAVTLAFPALTAKLEGNLLAMRRQACTGVMVAFAWVCLGTWFATKEPVHWVELGLFAAGGAWSWKGQARPALILGFVAAASAMLQFGAGQNIFGFAAMAAAITALFILRTAASPDESLDEPPNDTAEQDADTESSEDTSTQNGSEG